MEIITVKMNSDCTGCPDGLRNRAYFKGETYNLPEALANAFLDMKVATEPEQEKVEVKPAKKVAVTKAKAKSNKDGDAVDVKKDG